MPKSLWFIDTLIDVHIDGAATNGEYALLECLAPSGHQPPPHVHEREAEGFLVLEGELTLRTAAGEQRLGPGMSANSPAGEPHAIEVTSSGPCRWLVVSSPAGFEDFVSAFGTPAPRRELPVLDGPPDLERLAAVAGEHGIRVLPSVDAQFAAAGA